MEISEYLTDSRNPNEEVRKLGEKKIEEAAMSNFGQFMFQCAKELNDDKKIKMNRQMAATLIKNMLNFMPKFQGKWETLGLDIKSEIKSLVLSTLASPEIEIRKAAALCTAGIFKLEHPQNSWPELIDILVETCRNENVNFQAAAIITLGYISQEINPNDFQVSDVDKILTALIGILKETKASHEIIKTSLIAFVNYIDFAKKNFENKVYNLYNF